MSDPVQRFLVEAQGLIGTRFRLYGRDPDTGLDCVGLICVSLARSGHADFSPSGYRLKTTDVESLFAWAGPSGLVRAEDTVALGDVLHVRCGAAQHHLMIAESHGWAIHAHSGLRRVVRQPIPTDWPLVSHWRLAPTTGH